jgi:hypothetical protein
VGFAAIGKRFCARFVQAELPMSFTGRHSKLGNACDHGEPGKPGAVLKRRFEWRWSEHSLAENVGIGYGKNQMQDWLNRFWLTRSGIAPES